VVRFVHPRIKYAKRPPVTAPAAVMLNAKVTDS
jgi:hypothetical protein